MANKKIHQLPLWMQDMEQHSNRWHCAACHACDTRLFMFSISGGVMGGDFDKIVESSHRICNACGIHITPVREATPNQQKAYRNKLQARRKGN